METVLMIVVLVIVAWFMGFVRSIRKAANMANKEMDFQADNHEVSLINRRAAMKITEANVAKAKENMALLESIRLD